MLEKTTLRSHLKLSVVSIPCFKEACFFPVLKQLKYWPDQPIKIKVERQKREKKKKVFFLNILRINTCIRRL